RCSGEFDLRHISVNEFRPRHIPAGEFNLPNGAINPSNLKALSGKFARNWNARTASQVEDAGRVGQKDNQLFEPTVSDGRRRVPLEVDLRDGVVTAGYQ